MHLALEPVYKETTESIIPAQAIAHTKEKDLFIFNALRQLIDHGRIVSQLGGQDCILKFFSKKFCRANLNELEGVFQKLAV
jgi:hypothetical protein